MNKKFLEEMRKMMVQVFNDGIEALIFPKFAEIDQKFDQMDKKIEQSKKELKKELIEAFKVGQASLSNRLEEIEVDTRQIVKDNKDYGKRLDKVERIVKAN